MKKFAGNALSAGEAHEDLLQAVRRTYTSAPSSDRDLRDLVIDLWLIIVSRIVEEREENVEAVMLEIPDFAMDLSMRLLPFYGTVEMDWRCPCGRVVYGRGMDIFRSACPTCMRPLKDVADLSVRPTVKMKPCW